MVKSLKTEDKVKTIDVEISNISGENLEDAEIILKTNDNNVEINEFSSGILKETIFAVVKTLKMDEEINNLKIKVEE